MQIAFLAIHERRQPKPWLYVRAPAIEMEVPAGVPVAAVSAIEANDVIILVFNPDASHEPAMVALFGGCHVENQAAHFAKEFAANIVKLVVLLIEAVGIDKDHLQKPIGQELHGEAEEVSDGTDHFPPLAAGVIQGHERYTLSEVGAAKEVLVAGRHRAQVLIGLQVLNVGLD